jgi:hypothetical protein
VSAKDKSWNNQGYSLSRNTYLEAKASQLNLVFIKVLYIIGKVEVKKYEQTFYLLIHVLFNYA